MAKNRVHEKTMESSDDDDSSSKDSGSEESDSEPELTQTPAAAAAAKKPQRQSGSGSESESDGSNPKDRPTPTQKSTNGSRKSRSKSSAPDPVTPAKPVALKRRAEDKKTDGKDAKKSKKKAEPETSEKNPTSDPKKSIIPRVWSEEDEIVILEGLIDYSVKKKADPFADVNGFHDYIKNDLQRKDSTKTQFQDKIRRLKNKYENNRNKEKKSKKEITFPKPHEQKVYNLSKSVWGNKNVKENGVKKVVGTVVAVDIETESVLPAMTVKSVGVTVEERVLAIGKEMFEKGKGVAGEKEWAELKIEEMQVYVRHLEVKAAQTKVVMEGLKSEGI